MLHNLVSVFLEIKFSNMFLALEYALVDLTHYIRTFSAMSLSDVYPPYHFELKILSDAVAQSGATLRAPSASNLIRCSLSGCSHLNASSLPSVHGTTHLFNVVPFDRYNKMGHSTFERF